MAQKGTNATKFILKYNTLLALALLQNNPAIDYFHFYQ
jgi:hypothetical protein